MKKLIAGGALALALVACTSGTSAEWSEFPSGLRSSVDAYAVERDCVGLQTMFDSVDAADGSHPDILGYIDQQMRETGCYN